jgi:hypothetical protein
MKTNKGGTVKKQAGPAEVPRRYLTGPKFFGCLPNTGLKVRLILSVLGTIITTATFYTPKGEVKQDWLRLPPLPVPSGTKVKINF